MMTGLPTYIEGDDGTKRFGSCIEFPTTSGPVRLPAPSDGGFFCRNLRAILDLQVKTADEMSAKNVDDPVAA